LHWPIAIDSGPLREEALEVVSRCAGTNSEATPSVNGGITMGGVNEPMKDGQRYTLLGGQSRGRLSDHVSGSVLADDPQNVLLE
jgi:hypothetical protein